MKSGYTVAIAILFFSVSASAQKFNRSELREATRQNCPTQLMADKRFIDILLLAGGSLENFCECLATRFVAQLDDADYGNENALNIKWVSSKKFCLVTLIK